MNARYPPFPLAPHPGDRFCSYPLIAAAAVYWLRTSSSQHRANSHDRYDPGRARRFDHDLGASRRQLRTGPRWRTLGSSRARTWSWTPSSLRPSRHPHVRVAAGRFTLVLARQSGGRTRRRRPAISAAHLDNPIVGPFFAAICLSYGAFGAAALHRACDPSPEVPRLLPTGSANASSRSPRCVCSGPQ